MPVTARRIAQLILVAAAAMAVACTTEPIPPNPPPPPPPPPPAPSPVATVEVAAGVASILVGNTVQLSVTVHDAAGNALGGRSVVWSTSAGGVATVSQAGLVTGTGRGSATISAVSEGVTGSATIASAYPLIDVAVGDGFTCARDAGDKAYCWGRNAHGQLGDGTGAASSEPVPVAGDLALASLTSYGRGRQVCGATATNAYCWGTGYFGDDPDGPFDDTNGQKQTVALAPMALTVPEPVRVVSIGEHYGCGVTNGQQTVCWGTNAKGEMFHQAGGAHGATPVPVPEPLVSIAAGFVTSCGLSAGGRAYCWGSNGQGQFGTGTFGPDYGASVVVAAAGNLRFATLGVGELHVCGVTTDEGLLCWGWGAYGQLGLGTTDDQAAPTAVPGTWRSVAVGPYGTCAIDFARRAWCWGAAAIGDGSDSVIPDVPAAVSGGLEFERLAVGMLHTCGITTGNELYCWGENTDGELGDGTTTARRSPVVVAWPR